MRRRRSQSVPELMAMTYQDELGRHWKVMVPVKDPAPERGIIIGPPDLASLGLPEEVTTRLHNELFSRGLLTKHDLRNRGQEVFAAVQAAYRADVVAVMNLYG